MIETLLPIGMLGALLGLDTVSFPQAMLARPLVAATCGGALLGSPLSGLMMGAALELIAVETLPFGASRYPEWGSASAVGGALFAESPGHPAGALTIALIAALSTAWVGSWSMVKLRQANARWATDVHRGLEAGARGTVIGLQLKGMTADLLRGFVLTMVAWAVFAPMSRISLPEWTFDARVTRALTVAVATSVAGGAAWKIFHHSLAARWTFVAGLGLGFLLLLTR
jgi:mannose/fructose/N-acetylgalactosamine-specific phosphotransferase system component IIC